MSLLKYLKSQDSSVKLVKVLFYKYIYTSKENPLRIKLFIDFSTLLGLSFDMHTRPDSDLLAYIKI